MKLFAINLQPPPPPRGYKPGSVVSGTLLVETQEPKNYRQIEVSFKGIGQIEYEHNDTRWKGKEEYVDETVVVWQDDHGLMLSAGVRKFSFSFTIPESCPASIELGKWFRDQYSARIQYLVVGRILTKGLLKQNHTTQEMVVVRGEPSVSATDRAPVKQHSRATKGLLKFASRGTEGLTVELPRSVYRVGEKIPASVLVENVNSARIFDLETALLKVVALKASGHTLKKPPKTVAKITTAVTNGVWSTEIAAVPDDQPTLQSPGGMLSVTYEVRAKLNLGLAQRLEVNFPVIIMKQASRSST